MAIYYFDMVLGNDAARATLTNCIASNPSGTTVRITKTAHGLVTGAKVTLSLFTAWLNSARLITKVDADNFDLDGMVWAAAADVDGSVVPHGGQNWADAFASFAGLGTKIVPGDTARFAKSDDPTSLGQDAQWTSCQTQGGIQLYSYLVSSTNASPIQITKTAHGWLTGDIIHLNSHAINTNANGVWFITKVNDNAFTLDGSVGNGVGGATGSIQRITSKCVVLTTPVTTDICLCDASWTPGTNITSATLQQTNWKFGAGAPAIITGASCGANQILAKFGLPASIDLSDKKQISFWFRPQTTAITAGQLQIRLYNDSACTALVETLDIPALPTIGYWYPVTINKGSALSATVQGIALYTTVAQASKTFYIDNVMACKDATSADSISLQSLISKNIPGQIADHIFVAIQSIKGRILQLEGYNMPNSTGVIGRGYHGITESQPLYKMEAIKRLTWGVYLSVNGSAANHILATGGWDRSSNTRTGLTIIDGLNGANNGLMGYYASYMDFENFQTTRFASGYWYTSYLGNSNNLVFTNINGYGFGCQSQAFTSATNMIAFNCATGIYLQLPITPDSCSGLIALGCNTGVDHMGAGCVVDTLTNNNMIGYRSSNLSAGSLDIKQCNFNQQGVYSNGGSYGFHVPLIRECNDNNTGIYVGQPNMTYDLIQQLNRNGVALNVQTGNCVFREITQCNDSTSAIMSTNGGNNWNVRILKITEADHNYCIFSSAQLSRGNSISNANFSNTVSNTVNAPGEFVFINCTGLVALFATLPGNLFNYRIISHNHNSDGNHLIMSDYAYIQSDATERHTASGISWKFAITNVIRSIGYPMDLSVTKVLCTAGVAVTVGIWVKKSHATDIGGRLIIMGNKYEGIGSYDNDILAVAPDITTWNQITITFTPTKTEVIEIMFEAFWVSGLADETIWIDDIDVVET